MILITIILLSIYSKCSANFEADDDDLTIPVGLRIGVASAAYQIEGAWNVSDKGVSNWDAFTHLKNRISSDQSNGDIACDSYHKYKEDIEIINDTGFNYYRFSLSWSRILPTGFSSKISQDGLQHYHNVIDELLAKGIEPFITVYHWDHPEIFEKMGGWTNEIMVEYFVDYARIVFQEFGSKVKLWATLNEPNVFCQQTFERGLYAPGTKLPGLGAYLCVHNMLKAHARTYQMYNEEFRKNEDDKIGIVVAGFHYFPAYENDTESADIAFQFGTGWITNPIFSENGDYPEIMKERILENSKLQGLSKSRLPEFSPEWIELLKGSSDFLGLNHYTSYLVQSLSKNDRISWPDDSGISQTVNSNWATAASQWLSVVPEGFREILNKFKKEYNNPCVYVTENGYSGFGNESNIHDIDRINYFYSYIKEMILAIKNDNCNVQSYTVWSLLDDFEWDRGYLERFGIVHVDFTDPNRKRTPRLSVSWLKHVMNQRQLISFKEFNANQVYNSDK